MNILRFKSVLFFGRVVVLIFIASVVSLLCFCRVVLLKTVYLRNEAYCRIFI